MTYGEALEHYGTHRYSEDDALAFAAILKEHAKLIVAGETLSHRFDSIDQLNEMWDAT